MGRTTRAMMISMPATWVAAAIPTRRDESNCLAGGGDPGATPCGRPVLRTAAFNRVHPPEGATTRVAPTSSLVRRTHPLPPRHDVAARLAGAVRLIVEKARVGLRHRISPIIVHLRGLLVQQLIAARTEPSKSVDFARPPLPFDHQEIRVGREARRMRRAGRRVDRRPFGDDGDLLLAVRGAVM